MLYSRIKTALQPFIVKLINTAPAVSGKTFKTFLLFDQMLHNHNKYMCTAVHIHHSGITPISMQCHFKKLDCFLYTVFILFYSDKETLMISSTIDIDSF